MNAPVLLGLVLAQTNAPSITIKTRPDDQIQDIRPPYFYLNSTPWWLFVLAALALAGLGVLLYFLLRPRRRLSARSAYELALEKLEAARALLREESAMPYAVMVSETVRVYLGQRFHAPSPRRTTEEFLRQMEADRATPLAEHRELLRDFLQSCDLVKFARYQPTLGELEHVQQRASDFVHATKPPEPTANGRHP